MPIYEYACPACGGSFEILVRSTTPASEIVCPTCGNPDVRKKVSTFASSVKGGSTGATSSTSCAPGGL